jgi:hypothetical protein
MEPNDPLSHGSEINIRKQVTGASPNCVCLRSAAVVTASQFRHIDMDVNSKH